MADGRCMEKEDRNSHDDQDLLPLKKTFNQGFSLPQWAWLNLWLKEAMELQSFGDSDDQKHILLGRTFLLMDALISSVMIH